MGSNPSGFGAASLRNVGRAPKEFGECWGALGARPRPCSSGFGNPREFRDQSLLSHLFLVCFLREFQAINVKSPQNPRIPRIPKIPAPKSLSCFPPLSFHRDPNPKMIFPVEDSQISTGKGGEKPWNSQSGNLGGGSRGFPTLPKIPKCSSRRDFLRDAAGIPSSAAASA